MSHESISTLSSASVTRSEKWLLVVAIGLFVSTRVFILFVLEPQYSDLENTYFSFAMRVHDGQLIPYQEHVAIAYPPVAWWIMYAPRFFDSRSIDDPHNENQVIPVWRTYCRVFRGFMFLCDVGSLTLLLLIVKLRRAELLGWAALTYTFVTSLLGHLLYDRLDLGLLFLLFGWAFCWLKSRYASKAAMTWLFSAYALLGFGISYKLIPIICVPFVALADLRMLGGVTRFIKCFAVLIAAAGLPFLVQYFISGPAVFDFLQFHSERGIQIESLYSSVMMIGSLLGWHTVVEMTHGAFELSSELARPTIIVSNFLLLAFLAGTWLWVFFRRQDQTSAEAYCVACFVLVASVILAKVLSPQYFVWALPISMLLAAELLPQKRAAIWVFTLMLIGVAGLTTWIFPYHYVTEPGKPGLLPAGPEDAANLQAGPCIVLAARNFLYLVLVVWLGCKLFFNSNTTPAPVTRKSTDG